MTELFVKNIASSKQPCQYIQPHFKRGEHIVSHRISCGSFMDLYNHFKPQKKHVVTRYHDGDILYENVYDGERRHVTCSMTYRNESFSHENIEFIGEGPLDLSITRFSPMLTYCHERQSIQLIRDNSRYTMVLEILIPNITEPKDLYPKVNGLLEQIKNSTEDYPADIISLSYRFILKNKVTLQELQENISLLQRLTMCDTCIARTE